MYFAISINLTSSLPILGLFGGIFHFYSNCNRQSCMQTVEALIRRHVMWRLIWVCVVCIFPTKRRQCLNRLMFLKWFWFHGIPLNWPNSSDWHYLCEQRMLWLDWSELLLLTDGVSTQLPFTGAVQRWVLQYTYSKYLTKCFISVYKSLNIKNYMREKDNLINYHMGLYYDKAQNKQDVQ